MTGEVDVYYFSGPRALAEPHGDVADVYAFPGPGQPGRLVLAMNVAPTAPDDASFSKALVSGFGSGR